MDGEKTSITPSILDNNNNNNDNLIQNNNNNDDNNSATKIRVLVVDNDTICLGITASVLNVLNYEVVTTKSPLEAMTRLRMKNGSFDMVLSDVQLPLMHGLRFRKLVEDEFRIPVILMSTDVKNNILLQNMKSEGAFLVVKPPTVEDVKFMWEYVELSRNKFNVDDNLFGEVQPCNEMSSKNSSVEVGSQSSTLNSNNNDNDNNNNESISSKIQKQKSTNIEAKKSSRKPKKHKMQWTAQLHKKFVDAIMVIGEGRAVPKKIMEYMNEPTLTRENIASHLQKFRIYEKRKQKEAKESLQNDNMDQNWSVKSRSNFSLSPPIQHTYNPLFLNPNPLNLNVQNYNQFQGNLSQINPSYGGLQGLNFLNNSQPNNINIGTNNFVHNPPNYYNCYGNNYNNNNGDFTNNGAMPFMPFNPNTNFNNGVEGNMSMNMNNNGGLPMVMPNHVNQEGTQHFHPISNSNVPYDMNNSQVSELFGLSNNNAYNNNNPQLLTQGGAYFDGGLNNIVNNNNNNNNPMLGISGHNYNNGVDNHGNMCSNINFNMMSNNMFNTMTNASPIYPPVNAFDLNNGYAVSPSVDVSNLNSNVSAVSPSTTTNVSDMTSVFTTGPPMLDMNNVPDFYPSINVTEFSDNLPFDTSPPVNVSDITNVSIDGEQDIVSNMDNGSNNNVSPLMISTTHMDDVLDKDYNPNEDLSAIFSNVNARKENNN